MTDEPTKQSSGKSQQEIDKLKEEVASLKELVTEQEERVVPVMSNLFNSFTTDEFKANRQASIKAAATLLAKWYLRRGVIVGTVGIVGLIGGIFTLWFTYQQTSAIVAQNKLFTEQNKLFISQNELFQQQMIDQQRSTNAQILGSLLVEIESAAQKAKKDTAGYWKPSQSLVHRIHSAARAFAPYGSDSLSYERGQLVQAIANAKIRFPLYPNPLFDMANLRRADLNGADLFRANLFRANLRRAKLTKAELSGAVLSGAELSWAELFRANLIRANLTDANLIRAKLIRADLSEAYLHRADLTGADLSEAELTWTELFRSNLTDVDIKTDQLVEVGTLFQATMDSVLEESLRTLKPELFLPPNSESRIMLQIEKSHDR